MSAEGKVLTDDAVPAEGARRLLTGSAMPPAIAPLGGGLGFGATVSGVDLRHTDHAGWAALGQALLEHSLLIVRDQHGLSPADEMGVYERLHEACGVTYSPPPPDDPDEAAGGEEEEGGSLFELYTEREEGDQELNLRGRSLPGFPAVTLLGHGPVRDHWGLPDGALIAAPLGHGCPVNWHADGEFFSRDAPPSRLLQLYCIATPAQGGGLWQRTEDDAIRYAPGGTLFSSSHIALEQLSPELRTRGLRGWPRATPASARPSTATTLSGRRTEFGRSARRSATRRGRRCRSRRGWCTRLSCGTRPPAASSCTSRCACPHLSA